MVLRRLDLSRPFRQRARAAGTAGGPAVSRLDFGHELESQLEHQRQASVPAKVLMRDLGHGKPSTPYVHATDRNAAAFRWQHRAGRELWIAAYLDRYTQHNFSGALQPHARRGKSDWVL